MAVLAQKKQSQFKANSKPILNGMDIILNTEDCRGPTGLAMTECGSFPAGLLEKTKPIL